MSARLNNLVIPTGAAGLFPARRFLVRPVAQRKDRGRI